MNRTSIRSAVRFCVLALTTSALLSLPLFAQDAGQVLQLSVGFRTIKNRTPMSDDKRKEVEALEAKARKANDEKQFGEAYKHMQHGIALMRNQPWTPMAALNSALQLKLDRRVFDPGEVARVKVSQMFALDEAVKGKLKLTVALAAMRDRKSVTIKELKTWNDVTPDFTKEIALDVALPQVEPDNYQLVLTLAPAEGESVNKPTSIRIERNLNAEAEQLKRRITTVRADLEGRHLMTDQQGLMHALAPAEYVVSLVDLVNNGSLQVERVSLKAEFDNTNALLDRIVKGENPLKGQRGDIRWAYISAVDKAPQPYRLYIPTGYDAKRKWPLVVALHGMGGDENSFFTAYNNGEIKRIAEERGYIIACPKGRAPTSMYMGTAERDVLDVLKEVKREYAIDDNRVYLMGHSMGGYGTWSVSVNNPDLFAAIAPISGGGTPFVTAKLKGLTNVPWIVTHGDKDPTVSVEESRKMVKAGKDLGIEIKYNEVPGGDHGNVVAPAFKEIFDWFDAHKRQPAAKAAAKAASSGN